MDAKTRMETDVDQREPVRDAESSEESKGELQDHTTMKRTYKDSVFCDLFRDPGRALELYRELHPDDTATTVADIDILTFKTVVVNGPYNDLGFQIGNRLIVIMEHQSTWTPNILIRALIYYVETLKRWVSTKEVNLYGGSAAELPAVEIYVVYTGNRKTVPQEISLRRDFPGGEHSMVDAEIKVLRGGGNGILSEYVEFTKVGDRLRTEYGSSRDTAEKIVRYCIEKDILREYLIRKRVEVVDMLETLFDEQEARRIYDLDMRRQYDKKMQAMEQDLEQERNRVRERDQALEQERNQALERERRMVLTMLENGEPLEKVALYSGLSAERVEEIAHSAHDPRILT